MTVSSQTNAQFVRVYGKGKKDIMDMTHWMKQAKEQRRNRVKRKMEGNGKIDDTEKRNLKVFTSFAEC